MGLDETRPILGLLLERDLGIKIFPIHRLDFEVSGLIMFAKTPSAQRSGNQWFEKKEVTKIYYAQSKSIDKKATNNFKVMEEYLWTCKLLRGKKRAYESPMGKESLTKAVLVKCEQDVYHWELSPITGRSHQLRYELFRHGQAIIGDELYSSLEAYASGGIALRAFQINFKDAPGFQNFFLPEKLEIEKNI